MLRPVTMRSGRSSFSTSIRGGAAGPERDELRSLGSGGLQWSYKASHGYRAAAKTTAQRGAVLHTLGETVATGPYPTVLVVNTLAHARSGVVEVELPASWDWAMTIR